jgi:hypothetical protein
MNAVRGAFAAGFVLVILPGSAQSAVVYNLDFEAPAHAIGGLPSVGTGANRVSAIPFGSPRVVNSATLLNGNSLEFEGLLSYEQISLSLPVDSPRWSISFDVVTQNLVNSQYAFTVLLDTPEVRSISFHSGVDAILPYQPAVTLAPLQAFVDGHKYHLDIDVDFTANRWSTSVDGVQRLSAPINATDVNSVRFSMAPAAFGAVDEPNTKAFLDNVRVLDAAVIPEPTSALIGFALCFVAGARPRGRTGRQVNS